MISPDAVRNFCFAPAYFYRKGPIISAFHTFGGVLDEVSRYEFERSGEGALSK